MSNTTPLADEMRALRRDHGNPPQDEFGRRVGISPAMIGHVEAGRRSLGVESVQAIVTALGLNRAQAAALMVARNKTSAMLRGTPSSARPPTDALPPTEVDELRGEVKTLVALVAELRRRVARLERSKDDATPSRGAGGRKASAR